MKEMILKMAMPMVVNMIQEMITEENIKIYGDKLFDLIEEFVIDSKTKIDDATILPLIKAAREALNIPG